MTFCILPGCHRSGMRGHGQAGAGAVLGRGGAGVGVGGDCGNGGRWCVVVAWLGWAVA